LIAPVKIGKKSIIGAGSAITRNVKDKSLALTRTKQIEIKNYKKK
jgi:bifunctional UDP-N-acetylglucosamine pyrophosphorylase/glucosamine-1-phosphate N-acetyltransferase